MCTGTLMVNGVVAIIKKHCIEKTDKISGMVILRFFICMHMLNVIKNKHTEYRYLMRNRDKYESLLPIKILTLNLSILMHLLLAHALVMFVLVFLVMLLKG